jgi:OmpA-OmpF porin, OOP family
MKTSGKIIIFILALGLGYGALRVFAPGVLDKIMPGKKEQASVVPNKITLPDAYSSPGQEAPSFDMPTPRPAGVNGPEVRMLVWAWNAQMGLMFANGGPETTEGSLMAKHNVNLHLSRQDDSAKMQDALVAFATELSNGVKEPKGGAHFVAIMGDGAGMFLANLNKQLSRLGSGYQAKVITSCGYSRGEDKFMGPLAWKRDPQKAMGGVVSGYLRDGDWNIAQKWLGDNGLRTNPDEKTYDPDALNWVAANDYLDACDKYITGYTEDRPVVRNGKRTGKTQRIKVDAVVTWTPGDVNVAQKKGGLVSIVSTKEYASQMPNVVIGIDKWMQAHKPIVTDFVRSIAEGGAAVKSSDDALYKAATISQQVYQEQGADAAYWMKYYKGVTENDRTGLSVELGGSKVSDLADAMFTFGLVQGGANLFEATYTVFASLVQSQYPDLMPSYPPAASIQDLQYLRAVAAANPVSPQLKESISKDIPRTAGKQVLSSKNWNIPFESGKASFSPYAKSVLERLRRDLLIASGTSVEIQGHTDNVGSPEANMQLSEDRAFAMQQWLEKQFPRNFPAGRVRIRAMGQTAPVASNRTPEGRARNRRVEVVLSTTK